MPGMWREDVVVHVFLSVMLFRDTYPARRDSSGAKGNGTYIVKAGDTLTGISVNLGVTIQYLVNMNGIKNPDYIVVGQVIKY